MHGRRDRRSKKLAFLALASERHHDELIADFQQYYGLDISEACLRDGDLDTWRIAALARQLPNEGRTKRAIAPTAGNSPELLMLRRIEYTLRKIEYSLGGGKLENGEKAPEPQPILLDGESEDMERLEKEQKETARDVAAAFNLDI